MNTYFYIEYRYTYVYLDSKLLPRLPSFHQKNGYTIKKSQKWIGNT